MKQKNKEKNLSTIPQQKDKQQEQEEFNDPDYWIAMSGYRGNS